MTAIWGPLGWMTLHSVSSIYPENPTDSEKALMKTWLDMFRDTITCHYCKGHFIEMLDMYRLKVPTIMNSRQDFMAFVFRAHNTVNRRLKKPVYDTVESCMEALKNNVRNTSARQYRNAYLTHIKRYWTSMRDMSGIAALRKITEMMKIEIDYITPRDTNFNVEVQETQTIFPYGVLEKVEENPFGAKIRKTNKQVNLIPKSVPIPVNKPIERPKGTAGFTFSLRGLHLRR